MEDELLTTEQALVPMTEPAAATDYYVLASDLGGNSNPLANIPKWVWIAAAAGAVYLYWKKNKDNERDLLEESQEE